MAIDRNIQNRKLSTSGTYSFSKTEGKVEAIRENRFRPDRQQFKVDPDSGTRYACYITTIKKDGEVLAESATAGMKKRVRDLSPPKKK